MKNIYLILVASCWFPAGDGIAQTFKRDVVPLVKASCIKCHDADTKTRLTKCRPTPVNHNIVPT